MTFWSDMEGNVTAGTGSITVTAQSINTNIGTTVYKTINSEFPENMFGYERHLITFDSLTDTFRVLITGI